MKLLVTGYNGFIGKNLIKTFQSKRKYKLFLSDFDQNIDKKIKNIDAVIHLGAISSTAEKNVEKIWKYNVENSLKIIDKCKSRNIDFIFASSASVYGRNRFFKESSKVSPLSPYAWSKYIIDQKLLSDKNINPKLISLRLFNVYGPYEDHKKHQMSPVSSFIKQSKKTGIIKLFKNSKNYYRDFVCVQDVVSIIDKIINTKNIKNGIYNLGSGQSISFYDIAKYISKKYNSKIKEIDMPENIKFQYQEYTNANIKKIKENIISKYKFITPFEYIDQFI